MKFKEKIIPYDYLAEWRNDLQNHLQPLVVTNGCFDLLHPGHLFLLEEGRRCGQSLLVGVTCDSEVRRLKGETRPLIPEADRIALLAALESVSAVTIFPESDATRFISKSRPDLYIKGGDYTLETINQDERRLLESLGVPIHFLPKLGNRSTSTVVRALAKKLVEPIIPRVARNLG